MAETMTKVKNLLPGTRFSIDGRLYRKLRDTFPNAVSEETWAVTFVDPEQVASVSSDDLQQVVESAEVTPDDVEEEAPPE